MREFKTYEIKREMPTNDCGQISIPEFMVAQKPTEIKSRASLADILAIIQFIAFIAFVYFFMAIDWRPVMAWVGMVVSMCIFVIVNMWRNEHDRN